MQERARDLPLRGAHRAQLRALAARRERLEQAERAGRLIGLRVELREVEHDRGVPRYELAQRAQQLDRLRALEARTELPARRAQGELGVRRAAELALELGRHAPGFELEGQAACRLAEDQQALARLPLAELYRDDGMAALALGADELLLAVTVPLAADRVSGYEKLRVRGAIDFPLAGVAVSFARDGDSIAALRIACTGVSSRPPHSAHDPS